MKKFFSFTSIDDFVFIKKLGEGGSGKVFLAKVIENDMQVAIKKIKVKNHHKNYKKEYDILLLLNHPNIIKTYGLFYENNNYYLVFEYCEIDLFDYLENNVINEKECSAISYQILLGIKHCHDNNIIHRDIKTENIIIKDGIYKLIDFGHATYYKNKKLKKKTGTYGFMAPEMLNDDGYDFSIDIWCLGVMIYEMLTNTFLFEDKDKEKLKEKIINIRITYPDFFSENLIDLLKKIFVPCSNRITIDEMFNHPWINQK